MNDNKPSPQQDPVLIVEALKRMSPVVAITVIALTSYFNLQSQISELRTRQDINTTATNSLLLEMKQDIKDLKRTAIYDETSRRNNTVKRDPNQP